MKTWQIRYWAPASGKNPIEKWFDKLTADQFKSVTKELVLLERLGNELKMPHSRALNNGLFELRERRYGYRIYYTFRGHYIIVLLAAGDKGSQKKDIKIARERLLGEKVL